MKKQILDFINLHNGEEKREKVLDYVRSNTSFRGHNLWILACAIVIASVGLNVNSPAVIIGAMLISPLMGPIVGAGFALAIYDFGLLKKSAKNLFIATVVSLLVAYTYFSISPFKEAQSELLARTSPNIYDVLIAFFGGLVGVIALTRVEKGNPIPGVAIATALMPPLCTAGYGLAIGSLSFFFGAFYLYAINCFFICISTFAIVKYLEYEPVKSLNPRFEKQIRYLITTIILIMVVPSFYLAYGLLQEKKFNQKVEQFIANEFTAKGYILIFKKISYNTSPKKIEVAFLTKKVSPEDLRTLNEKLLQYNMANTNLEIRQETKDLKSEILSELGNQNKVLSEKDILINNLQNELNEYKIANAALLKEMNILFPELKSVSIGRHLAYQSDSAQTALIVLYQADVKAKVSTEKIEQWLNYKLQSDEVKLVKLP
jgi:uncharacterized hydrophobic protein (TIGR00271 family)